MRKQATQTQSHSHHTHHPTTTSTPITTTITTNDKSIMRPIATTILIALALCNATAASSLRGSDLRRLDEPFEPARSRSGAVSERRRLPSISNNFAQKHLATTCANSRRTDGLARTKNTIIVAGALPSRAIGTYQKPKHTGSGTETVTMYGKQRVRFCQWMSSTGTWVNYQPSPGTTEK